jgi:formate/nitrite transporter FocA (FNT family)
LAWLRRVELGVLGPELVGGSMMAMIAASSVAKIALTNMVTMTTQTACGNVKGPIDAVV